MLLSSLTAIGLLIRVKSELTYGVESDYNVIVDYFALDEKSTFKMLGLVFSSKFGLGFYIISIDKTTSKKIGGHFL